MCVLMSRLVWSGLGCRVLPKPESEVGAAVLFREPTASCLGPLPGPSFCYMQYPGDLGGRGSVEHSYQLTSLKCPLCPHWHLYNE